MKRRQKVQGKGTRLSPKRQSPGKPGAQLQGLIMQGPAMLPDHQGCVAAPGGHHPGGGGRCRYNQGPGSEKPASPSRHEAGPTPAKRGRPPPTPRKPECAATTPARSQADGDGLAAAKAQPRGKGMPSYRRPGRPRANRHRHMTAGQGYEDQTFQHFQPTGGGSTHPASSAEHIVSARIAVAVAADIPPTPSAPPTRQRGWSWRERPRLPKNRSPRDFLLREGCSLFAPRWAMSFYGEKKTSFRCQKRR